MPSWDEAERRRGSEGLPRLLAGRDRLTRLEKEEILAGVMKQVTAERTFARHPWRYALAAACAAGLLALAIPVLRRDDFAPKGDGAGGLDFRAYCTTDGQRSPCRSGTRLLFELRATPERRFFAAFSRRGDGTVIWYFPTDERGQSLDALRQKHGFAPTAFALGPEHSPGIYRVYGLFSTQPLTRQEVRSRVEGSTPAGDLIEKNLVVE